MSGLLTVLVVAVVLGLGAWAAGAGRIRRDALNRLRRPEPLGHASPYWNVRTGPDEVDL